MEVPHYPKSRSLEMADKPMLDTVFAALQPRISELTFAGLYLFRTVHAYRLTMVGDALVVLGRGYDFAPYFLPPLSGSIGEAVDRLLAEKHTLYGADEAFLNEYLRNSSLLMKEDRDNFDYLYLRKDMAELPGNRFHKKKNRINYFSARHECIFAPYSELYREGSLRLLAEWDRVHAEMTSRSLAQEIEANGQALVMAAQLGLEGLVALVGGEVKGFVLGERLNWDTSICQFEKADPFLDGLYQLIDREFNRLLFADCKFVNREQDLGEPNLRKSKLSYHPLALVKKFRVGNV